jgi:predicted nuclease of restriction endonuclease-like RecB superfamily
VSLNRLKMSIRKGKAHPEYANEEIEGELLRARSLLEERLGSRLENFDEEDVTEAFSDRKRAETGMSVLKRYYLFRSPSLSEVVGRENLSRLSAKGMDSPMEIRLAFFEHLSRDHSGFMSSESRDKLLEDFAAEIGLAGDILEQTMWLDEEDNRVLTRSVDGPPGDLAGAYNLEILSTILCNSYGMSIGPVNDGFLVKFIFRSLKLQGLSFDPSMDEEGGIVFRVDGPLALFGKSGKFGYRICLLLYRLRQLHARRTFECPIEVEFRKSKRRVTLEADASRMPDLSWPNLGDLRLQLFDSKIEAKIYSTFQTMDLGGWQVDREPRPVRAGESVFIPDFSLRRGSAEILVEVVGFWMPEYQKRKKATLKKLEKGGIKDLLLVVDQKFAGDFESSTGFPVFAYSKKGSSYRVPYSEILRYLDKRYPAERPSPEKPPPAPRPRYVESEGKRYKLFW